MGKNSWPAGGCLVYCMGYMPADSTYDAPAVLAPDGVERRKNRQSRTFRLLVVFVYALLAAAAVIIFGGLAYAAQQPGISGNLLFALMSASVLILLVFFLYIGRHFLLLFLERRGRLKRSRLPFRFLGIFSIIAVFPTLIIASFAFFMLNLGMETWFSGKVNAALENSLQIAQAYLDEHERNILLEVSALARDQELRDATFLMDPLVIQEFLQAEARRRNLLDLSLFTNQGTLIATTGTLQHLASTISTFIHDARGAVDQAGRAPHAFTEYDKQQVVALAPVGSGLWLAAARDIHPKVVARIDQTEAVYQEYFTLVRNRGYIRWFFGLLLGVMALGTLVAAVWVGLRLANRIVRPITELVHATNRVSAGQMDIRLPPRDDDEMGILTQSFNRMTQQLKQNRELVEKKNKELDRRRKTMEALLTGVSAGVFAVDAAGVIQTTNPTAHGQLGLQINQTLADYSPELAHAVAEYAEDPIPLKQKQIKLLVAAEPRTFLVRMVAQKNGEGEVTTIVVTMDDITPLLSAQKTAAWADVARRLAHEIKNPLTPIQLSAERLQRKYSKQLDAESRDLFVDLTKTIIQQTEDMRSMLNEFSDFARMPAAKMAPHKLMDIVKQAVFLEESAQGDIAFELDVDAPAAEAMVVCDRAHLNQTLTNILENAINSIKERVGDNLMPGKVKIVVKMSQDDTLLVTVQDNGKGIPADVDIDQLFDPYVTTRQKGTGLGLAIVRRVIEEHGGQVRLLRCAEGARVEITLPVKQEGIKNDDQNQ